MRLSALAFRSLLCRKKQYFPLFLMCVLCTGFSFFVFFLVAGMSESFRNKARLYYGGDLQFIGGRAALEFHETSETTETLRRVFPPEARISPRVEVGREAGSFYYEGTEVVLWVVKGVDFRAEENLFRSLLFSEFLNADASVGDIAGTDSILISRQIADRLGVTVGDSVRFFCRTFQGYLNSVDFRVGGIFLDSSVLGLYTAYCDIGYLRNALNAGADYSNRISVVFPDAVSYSEVKTYQKKLGEHFTMYPLVTDKQVFYDDLLEKRVFGSEPAYALITLDANQEEVSEITGAMDALFAFIVFLLSGIIVVGIGSSYRVIILKRINEIGIFMSIGMRNIRISLLLFMEVAFLLVAGCVAGLGFSGVLVLLSRFCDLSSIPGIDVFLDLSSLPFSFTLDSVLVFCLVIFVTTGLAVLFSIRKTMTISPVDAIRVTE